MHKVVGSDAGSKYHFRTAALTTAYLARFLVDLSSEALVEGHCERQVYEVAGAQRRTVIERASGYCMCCADSNHLFRAANQPRIFDMLLGRSKALKHIFVEVVWRVIEWRGLRGRGGGPTAPRDFRSSEAML